MFQTLASFAGTVDASPPRLKEAEIQTVSIYSNNIQLPWQRGEEEMQLLHLSTVSLRLLAGCFLGSDVACS